LFLVAEFLFILREQAMKRTRTKGKDEGLAVQAPAHEEDEGCPTTTTTCWIPEVPPNPLTQYYATRNPQGAQPVLSVIVPLWFTPGTTSKAQCSFMISLIIYYIDKLFSDVSVSKY
jgi:hypothetical protein